MMEACRDACGFGMSEKPCPFEENGDLGCCAECSTMSTLRWVLGEKSKPSRNGQDLFIEVIDSMRE